jgi:hypothetical protein
MAHETAGHDNPDHAHEHPTWKQYRWVALILTVITALEVWAYYMPRLVASPFFVPLLLIMSAVVRHRGDVHAPNTTTALSARCSPAR